MGLHRFARLAAAPLAALILLAAAAAQDVVPGPKPAEIVPAEPLPGVTTIPGAEAPEAAEAAIEDEAEEPEVASAALPRSGAGGVVVEPGIEALDISSAISRITPQGENAFATYLIDFVNPGTQAQSRVLVVDPGAYGGPGAPRQLKTPRLAAALTSDATAPIEILDQGIRPRVRIIVPGGSTVTVALRFAAPLNHMTAEMWDERALARFDTTTHIMQGAVLGLVIALGAWLAGIAVLRRDRMAGWLTALFGTAFLALVAGFGFTGPFSLAGIIVDASLALGLYALAAAFALAFVVHAIAPDGRWPGFAWIAAYAPWLATLAALLALFNAPYAAAGAKAFAALSLALAVVLIFARAWEGEGAARRLTFAAIFVLLAFAPLAMLETVPSSGRVAMLAATGLLSAALLMAAFATASGAPIALRQRVDRLVAQPIQPVAAPALPAAAPGAPPDARYGLALAAAHQGLWDWDLTRDRLFLSPSVEVLLGAKPGGLAAPGRDWSNHIHEDDLATFLSALEEYRRIGDVSFAIDFRGKGADGLYRWVQLRASFMSDGDRAARCVGLASDVSAQKESEALLLASARQDAVTGLANRAFLLEALGHRLAFAAPDRRYALLVFDLARFRTINHGLGHAAGDALLAAIGDRLRAAIPDHALPARLSGDVFAVVWPAEDADDAAEAAKLALDALAPPVEIAGQSITPRARGGLVMLDGRQRSAAAALGDGEAALVEARRQGAGSIVLFASEMGDAKARRAELERGLAGALDRGEIAVHYQPIVRVADSSLAGFEALLRWQHPERGLLPAEQFIQIAEESDLIAALDVFALRSAARDMARWRAISVAEPPLFVNVNLSARQLLDETFVTACENVATAHGLPRGVMHLEITETLDIEESGPAERALTRLRRAGFTLMMDDFGAGHSTPRRLAHLPFDAVKIDRSFLAGGDNSRSVLTSLLRMAADLGLETTVEGVEDEGAFAFLKQSGSTYAQGFHCGGALDEPGARGIVLASYAAADTEAVE